ncbi:MAG: LamG-like jellyroll fold domain-containing protein [Elusimicrobiota bacterium]
MASKHFGAGLFTIILGSSMVLAGAGHASAERAAYYGFDEGGGSVAHDGSGNGNDGSLSGPTWTAGFSGNALSFDGNDYVRAPDDDSLDITGSLTVEARVKIAHKDGVGTDCIVAKQEALGYDVNYHMSYRNQNDAFQFRVGNLSASTPVNSQTHPATGVWYHLAGVYDGSSVKLYVDAKLEDASYDVVPLAGNNGPLEIGASHTKDTAPNYWFNGVIDELVIHKRALSPDEVAARYGAWLRDAYAEDASGEGAGIQAGDEATIRFSYATEGNPITAADIDTALSLDGGSWLDGNGGIGSAIWSTGRYPNDTLTIALSVDGGVPTVAPGAVITLDGAAIKNGLGEPIEDSVAIRGSFDHSYPPDVAGHWKFDEGEGITAFDATGHGNDGRIYGATRETGIAGGALSFDGNDQVKVPNADSLNIAGPLTVEAWVYMTQKDGVGTDTIIVKQQRSGYRVNYHLAYSNMEDRFRFRVGNMSRDTSLYSETVPETGLWYHLAGVYDGTSMKLYINAEEEAATSAAPPPGGNDGPLEIGSGHTKDTAPNYWFNGLIDEPAVYSRALSAEEVRRRHSLNDPPVAVAGADLIVAMGDPVQLDGSGSSDPDSNPLSFAWGFASTPSGSSAELSDPAAERPEFTPDAAGDYLLSLVVNDGYVDSEPDTVTVTALTVEDKLTQALDESVETIEAIADEDMKAPDQKGALGNKLDVVLKEIGRGKYSSALKKLKTDIAPKSDGCAGAGAPDANDWIRTCQAQGRVRPLIDEAARLLDRLINP